MVNVKRKIAFYLLAAILCAGILGSVTATSEGLLVFDDAALFALEEIAQLEADASALSDAYDMDIVIVTTNDAEGKTSRAYADDYFDHNGFGRGDNLDGILFLIDMENRETYISKSGEAIRYLTDKRTEDVLARVLEGGIAEGDYYNATKGFLSGTKEYLESGIPSGQYSEDENADVKEKNTLTPLEAIISLVAGLLASARFYSSTKAKSKMKNPVKVPTFREHSSVNFASEDDILLDTILTHKIMKKPASGEVPDAKSTTHTSSSGKTHGGSGTKF